MNLQFDDDFADVIGGVDPTPYLRTDRIAPVLPPDASDLDVHIAQLLALHPDVCVAFRNQDLGQLDHQTKAALLDDLNELLGIQPLMCATNDFTG